MPFRSRPIAIDLFCGAGGMSLGFEQSDVNVLGAIDSDPIHVMVYEHNFPQTKVVQADLSQCSGQEIRELTGIGSSHVDVVFGGPPCQGFSMMGRRRAADPRSELLLHSARLISELQPSYFVVENVAGLLMGGARTFVDSFIQQVASAGYLIAREPCILDASNFGVPQRRRRVFILGYRDGLPVPKHPSVWPFAGQCGTPTVWDAIGDLPDVDRISELQTIDAFYGHLGVPSEYASYMRGELADPTDRSQPRVRRAGGLTGCLSTAHSPETVARFSATAPGTYEPISRYFRLTKSGLAPTLRAGTDKSLGSFMAPRPIHPVYPRCITVREAARLQSFPDWFRFHRTKWHAFRQIGNSVPPRLARAVALSVYDAITERDGTATVSKPSGKEAV